MAASPELGLPAESGRYGLRVTVDAAASEQRELGSFDSADQEGNISLVRITEELHGTSVPGVSAVSYGFERIALGKFAPPNFWSFISVFSLAFIVSLFLFSTLNPGLNLGLPLWSYYSVLIGTFLISKLMETQRVARFLALSIVGRSLTALEERYAGAPILDLPSGRIEEARSELSAALSPLPPARIKAPVGALQDSGTEQNGELHGKVS